MREGKVLIIDDEPDIREGFRHMLDWDSLGLSIIGTASSGEEALPIIRKVSPDIVISDIVMHGLSGLDVIRKTKEAGIDTSFILISGYNDFRYAQKAISLGVSDYLLKPVDKDELLEALLKILGRLRSDKDASPDIEILRKNARYLFIQHLINGEIRSQREIEEGLSNFAVAFSDGESTVITIADRKGTGLSFSEKALGYIAESNAEPIESMGRNIIILNGNERLALHFTRQLLEMLSKDGGDGFIAGIGSTVPSLIDISRSYSESVAAISYQAYGCGKRIFTASDISRERPPLSTSDISIDELKRFIRQGDSAGIGKYMEDFFTKLLFASPPPPSYVKGMLLFLMDGIERGLSEDEGVSPDVFADLRPNLSDTMLLMDDIKHSVIRYFTRLSLSAVPEARIGNDRIIRECRKYVQDNIYGRISEDELASRLGVSLPYLSTYFSKATGETFRSYVNKMRNEAAKEMLSDGMAIESVSEKLGYSDYRSFHRIFKKMNGESPSRWKKNTR